MAMDFDAWSKLYREDPVEYERRRAEMLNETIMKAPVEHRNMLRMIKLEVDTIRQMYPDPVEATIRISEAMVAKMKHMKAELTRLREILEDSNDDQA